MNNQYDTIILGKGPAGLTCALYLQRANIKTLVVGKDDGNIFKANRIQNIFGISGTISGKELVENTIQNLSSIGCNFLNNYCTKIEPNDSNILVTLDSGEKYSCNNLVIAIGKSVVQDKYPKCVSYCATCDGFFYKNKVVAIKGNWSNIEEDVKYLSNICSKIYILSEDNKKITTDLGEIITSNISNYVLDDYGNLKKIIFDDGKEIEVSGLFVSENISLNSVKNFGIITKNNHIKVNENYMTNIKNVFAVGDVIGAPYQIAKACYDGMRCAMIISSKTFN